jgi:hypothetical protein
MTGSKQAFAPSSQVQPPFPPTASDQDTKELRTIFASVTGLIGSTRLRTLDGAGCESVDQGACELLLPGGFYW